MSTQLYPDFYNALLERFGPQHWWPADSAWETAAGAVLTQSTNWSNVEKAVANLKDADALDPERIAEMALGALAGLIRSSGYFNIKAGRLQNLAAWWLANADSASDPTTDTDQIRQSLLSVKGIGEETADCILLYAFERPRFVVDAYTRRILIRHGVIDDTTSYGEIQRLYQASMPVDVPLYNEYHALLVAAGKEYCRPTARCDGCPLEPHLALK